MPEQEMTITQEFINESPVVQDIEENVKAIREDRQEDEIEEFRWQDWAMSQIGFIVQGIDELHSKIKNISGGEVAAQGQDKESQAVSDTQQEELTGWRSKVTSTLGTIRQGLQPVWSAVSTIGTALGFPELAMLPQLLRQVSDMVGGIYNAVAGTIGFIARSIDFMMPYIIGEKRWEALKGWIGGKLQAIWGGIKNVGKFIWQGISYVVTTVIPAIWTFLTSTLWPFLVNTLLPTLWGMLVSIASFITFTVIPMLFSVVSAVISGIATVIGFLSATILPPILIAVGILALVVLAVWYFWDDIVKAINLVKKLFGGEMKFTDFVWEALKLWWTVQKKQMKLFFAPIRWVYQNILRPLGEWVGVNILFPMQQWLWNKIYKPIWGIIESYIMPILNKIWGFVKPILDKVWGFMKPWLMPLIKELKPWFTKLWNNPLGIIKKLFGGFFNKVFLQKVKKTINQVFETIRLWIDKNLISKVKPILNKVASKLKTVFDWVKSIYEWAIGPVKAVKEKAKQAAQTGGAVVKDVASRTGRGFNRVTSFVTGRENRAERKQKLRQEVVKATQAGNINRLRKIVQRGRESENVLLSEQARIAGNVLKRSGVAVKAKPEQVKKAERPQDKFIYDDMRESQEELKRKIEEVKEATGEQNVSVQTKQGRIIHDQKSLVKDGNQVNTEQQARNVSNPTSGVW